MVKPKLKKSYEYYQEIFWAKTATYQQSRDNHFKNLIDFEKKTLPNLLWINVYKNQKSYKTFHCPKIELEYVCSPPIGIFCYVWVHGKNRVHSWKLFP